MKRSTAAAAASVIVNDDECKNHMHHICSTFISVISSALAVEGLYHIQQSVETKIWGPKFTKSWRSGLLMMAIAALILGLYVWIFGKLDC